MSLRPSWSLGFLLPCLLLVTAVLDVGLRFLPTERYAWRGWEVARRYRPVDGSAPFGPGVRYRTERTYGELAALGNLPQLRQYRPETFTTDAHGFRTGPADGAGTSGPLRTGAAPERERPGPETRVQPPAAIVIGSSFGVGLGVSDEQTLAAQLEALSGRSVYDAGGQFDDVSVEAVLRIARRYDMREGLVVLEWLERHDEAAPIGGAGQLDRAERACLRLLGRWGPPGCTRLRGVVTVSPLRILAERALRALQDDRLLPNGYRSRVVPRRLANGETMLFHPDEVAAFYRSQSEETAAAYVQGFAAELARANLELVVVLVPHKYSVYYPLFADPAPPSPDAEPFLDRLERRLRQSEVSVVNLSATYHDLTVQGFARREHLYWLDDAHWNPRGIAVAAASILREREAQEGTRG